MKFCADIRDAQRINPTDFRDFLMTLVLSEMSQKLLDGEVQLDYMEKNGKCKCCNNVQSKAKLLCSD